VSRTHVRKLLVAAEAMELVRLTKGARPVSMSGHDLGYQLALQAPG
jgi:hypothetical protein